jgi:hypothetical protein
VIIVIMLLERKIDKGRSSSLSNIDGASEYHKINSADGEIWESKHHIMLLLSRR